MIVRVIRMAESRIKKVYKDIKKLNKDNILILNGKNRFFKNRLIYWQDFNCWGFCELCRKNEKQRKR